MTINPQQTAVLVGDVAARRADRPVAADPHGTTAQADATKRAPAAEPQDGATAAPAAPEFPLQELSIEKDPELGRFVVKVLDAKTHEVVRQIPSEEWVRVLKSLRGAKGLFVDRKG